MTEARPATSPIASCNSPISAPNVSAVRAGLTIEQVATDVVRPVRMRVLRAGTPSDDPTFDGDDDPDTLHLAAYLDDRIASVSTWLPRPWTLEPDAPAWQLRGMATESFAR